MSGKHTASGISSGRPRAARPVPCPTASAGAVDVTLPPWVGPTTFGWGRWGPGAE